MALTLEESKVTSLKSFLKKCKRSELKDIQFTVSQ